MNFTPSTSRTSETLYLSAPAVVELVRRQGLRACLQGIADNIQADFCVGLTLTKQLGWPATRAKGSLN